MARLLSPEDVMGQLGVSRSFVQDHLADLGAIKVGRRIRFEQRTIDAYLERRRVREAPQPMVEAPTPIRRPALAHKSATNPLTGRRWGARA